jgi:hypothetical protein
MDECLQGGEAELRRVREYILDMIEGLATMAEGAQQLDLSKALRGVQGHLAKSPPYLE